MGIKNYLVEGVSGAGKSTVAQELIKRGYHVIDGDRELAYRGDPKTGEPLAEPIHENEKDKARWKQDHHIWDLDTVEAILEDHGKEMSFFCGGSRNFSSFIHLFDEVFILNVPDLDLLLQRIDQRLILKPNNWGCNPEEKALIVQSHVTKEDIPQDGIVINSTAPIEQVVDKILAYCDKPLFHRD